MAKQKRKKEAYISYRAVRDLHFLAFLLGNYIYWERFYGFDNGFYSLPTFIEMLPLTITWTIILAIHFWLVHRIQELRAERDTLQQELDERKQADSVLVRLRGDGEWHELADYEEEKPKHNHHP